MIKITITGNAAEASGLHQITSGTVGEQLQFEFGPEWKDLVRWACFTNGYDELPSVPIEVSNLDTITIPAEVFRRENSQPRVGVYGTLVDGSVVIPTIYAPLTCEPVARGARKSGLPPAPPTPDWTDKIEQDVDTAVKTANDAKNTAEDVKRQADTGEFDGATFTPATAPVAEGPGGHKISWTNDKGKPNPAPVNIMNGKSAYELALDNGYTGTEAEWLEYLRGNAVAAEDAAAAAQAAAREAAQHKNDAAGSAGAAAGSAGAASTFATNAAASAQTAENHKTAAAESQSAAAGSASAAAGSATAAGKDAAKTTADRTAVEQASSDIRQSIDGVAQEVTGQAILAQQKETNKILANLQDDGGGAGNLNGFGLNLGKNREVILSYTDPLTGTIFEPATLPTETTAAAIAAERAEINRQLSMAAHAMEGDGV